jgi:hypothetical protein
MDVVYFQGTDQGTDNQLWAIFTSGGGRHNVGNNWTLSTPFASA